MYFGVDYHPEHWTYPYAGTKENPEARWERDVELMVRAKVNAVRMGEFAWGLYEPEEGKYDFTWMRRAMDLMHKNGIKVVLGTPTAAPPLWLTRKHPEILPRDQNGDLLHPGTRHAYCLNSDLYWNFSQKIVTSVARALGDHPSLIAWQIHNGIGGIHNEMSFNEETEKDWHGWLKQKYETIGNLNDCMGSRFWGQTVTDWSEVPMPMRSPESHNPALVLDWMRFSSDTIVAYIKMQADVLHEITPNATVTTNLRPLTRNFDHFDVADVLDFVSVDNNPTIASRTAEAACEIDMMRSLKKADIRTPNNEEGFWVIEQKAGQVNWEDVNALVRPGVVRLFHYQLVSRGANGVFYFFWRQPRIGSEKFYGGVLSHHGREDNRVYEEVSRIGEEMQRLAPMLEGTKIASECAILFSHDNDWTLQLPMQPTRLFNLRKHIQLFHSAFHDRNLPVDFARPIDDLSKYKLIVAPSLHQLSVGEAQRLKLYVQNGGTLIGTFNTGMVDEHHIVPDTGMPGNLTDLFGLEVEEFDPLPEGQENHLNFKGSFHVSNLHPARLWCDVIKPNGCETLAVYAKDFYAGKPAITMNEYGLGKAIYVGTQSSQEFYYDLITWARGVCNIFPLLKVPDTVEVSMRSSAERNIYFLLNHQNSPVRLQFYKPTHDFLSGETITGKYDLPPHGVLVVDEKIR
jgi:beta-galactosidase